jgi:hypothetical protein
MASQIFKLHRREKRTRQFDIELVLVNTHWYLKKRHTRDKSQSNKYPGNLLRSIQGVYTKGS